MNITKEGLRKLAGRPLEFHPKAENLLLATAELDPGAGDDQQNCSGKYEYFQAFDPSDHALSVAGRHLVLYRKECHGPGRIGGIFHRSTVIWILDPRDCLLVPTRSKNKDLNGGKRSVSMGEHNKVGESYLAAAMRGAQEEMALELDPERLPLVSLLPLRAPEQRQMTAYFAYRLDEGEKSRLRLDPGEFEDQNWIPMADLRGLDLVRGFNFRPDQAVALATFVGQFQAGNIEF
jgi:ADP-ribose pyrophosphatase YjhB (NUDIX family)